MLSSHSTPPAAGPSGPMLARRALLCAGVAVAGCWVARLAAQPSPVRVTREEPVVRRTEFDARRPPPAMPTLIPPESGVCNTTFELAANVSYSAETLSPTTAKVYVDEIDLTTRVTFDIYTVRGAPAKLRAHEEAHREIGEHFYRNAATVATDIGQRLIGASFDGTGVDPDAAQQDGFDKVIAAIEQAYMARIRVPSAAANVRFDEITNHGLNEIDEAEAIALAIEPAAGSVGP